MVDRKTMVQVYLTAQYTYVTCYLVAVQDNIFQENYPRVILASQNALEIM